MFSDNDNLKNASGIYTDAYQKLIMQRVLELSNFISRKYIGCPNNAETLEKFNKDIDIAIFELMNGYNINKHTALEYIREGLTISVNQENV